MNDARSPHRPDYRLPVFARKNPQVTVLTLDEAVSQIGFLKDAPTLGTSTLDWDTINHRLIPWESENQISQALTEILAPHQDTQILLIPSSAEPLLAMPVECFLPHIADYVETHAEFWAWLPEVSLFIESNFDGLIIAGDHHTKQTHP